MKRVSIIAIIIIQALLLGGEFSQSGEFGEELFSSDVLVNDDTTGNVNFQTCPVLAKTLSGETVVAWADDRSTRRKIYVQRFDCDGNPIGDFIEVNDDVAGAESPTVAINESGRFVVAWIDYRDALPQGHIYTQIFDSSGIKIGANIKIDNVTYNSRRDPDIAIDNQGNYVVTWSEYDVYFQRFDSLGAPMTAAILANDATIDRQAWPAIAMDARGYFAIAWEDERHGYSDYDVYAQLFDSAGSAIGANFRVNDDDDIGIEWSPEIAADSLGNFVVIWHDLGTNGGLKARLFDPLGQALGAGFKVNDDTVSSGSSYLAPPHVARSYSGEFIVSWPSPVMTFPESGPERQGVVAQRYDKDGIRIGSNFRVQDHPYRNPEYVSVAIDNVGEFAVSWAYVGQLDLDVMIKFFDADGVAQSDEMYIANDAGCSDQKYPSASARLNNGFTVIWEDEREDNRRWFLQQFDNYGNKISSNIMGNSVYDRAFPTILSDSSENILVVWSRSTYLYGQRYNSSGDSVGARFQINDSIPELTGYDYWSPSTAINSQNIYIVAWKDFRDGHYNSNIYAQIYDSDDTPIGGNFLVNETGIFGNAGFPSITCDVNDNFIIAWTEEGDIYLRRYDGFGNPVGVISKLNDASPVYRPSLSADKFGNIIATWSEQSNIYMQILNSLNQPVTAKTLVNDDVRNEYHGYTSVAVTESGKFIIIWEDNRSGSPLAFDYDIYGQIFSRYGVPIGGNFIVTDSAYAGYSQCWPDLAVNGSSAMITWQDNRRAKGWDIYCHVIDLTESFKTIIEPDTMCLLQANSLDTNNASVFIGDFSSGYGAVDIEPASIIINGTISPVSSSVLSSYPGFTGPVMRVKVPMGDFISGYGMLWGIDTHEFDVAGEFNDGSPFAGKGEVVMIGHRSGDANNDGTVDLADVTYIIAHLYHGGQAPALMGSADVNCDASVNILDIVYLIAHLYKGGPAPCEVY